MTALPLFVYGTLRPGTGHPMQQWLARHSEDLGMAVYRGRLYRIDWYPGLLPSDNPHDRVDGSVLRLHDPALMSALDEYEGREFSREVVQVRLRDRRLQAWAYLYNRPLEGAPRIASGDFLRPGR